MVSCGNISPALFDRERKTLQIVDNQLFAWLIAFRTVCFTHISQLIQPTLHWGSTRFKAIGHYWPSLRMTNKFDFG